MGVPSVAETEAQGASALFIRFRFEVSSYDPCRGNRDSTKRGVAILLCNKAGESAIVTQVYQKNYYFFVDPEDPEAHVQAARHEHVPLPEDIGSSDCRYLGRGEMSEEEIELLVAVAKMVPSFSKARRIAHRVLTAS